MSKNTDESNRQEAEAEAKAAHNQNATKRDDCVYLKGHGWIPIM